MDATRISDGRPVMLKKLPFEEGPHELEINRLFSTEPLASNPRNHCAPLLDVIQLPNDPPIMVHSLLRPFYDPRFETFGEFLSFFSQVCEVSLALPLTGVYWVADLARVYNSCTRTMSHIGVFIFIFSFLSISFCRAYFLFILPQGLYVGKHHARPIKHVSQLVPPR